MVKQLVTLLVFTAIAMLITTAIISMIMINISAVSKFEQGTSALFVAESGVENAILRLLRNPSYSGETFSVGDGTVTVVVVNGVGEQKNISSIGRLGNFIRKIQVNTDYTGNVLTILSWKEI